MAEFESERRYELSAKVAMLEERSATAQKQLDRIESKFDKHANDETATLINIHESLVKFDQAVDQKIEDAIDPLQTAINAQDKKLNSFLTTFTTLMGIITFLAFVLEFFKEPIITKLFH